MPTKVINATLSLIGHSIKESEKSIVADLKDIKRLQDQINSLWKNLNLLVTDETFKGELSELDNKIEEKANDFENMKQELLAALLNGEWKQCFSEDIKKALSDINQRYSEINGELDKKMSQLAQAGAIEEKILQIFIEQEKKFRTVIHESGKQLKEELDKKMEEHGIIDILKIESQTITWEN